MAYVAITNGEIDTDSPLTTGLMTKFRDNPEAIAQGLSGATRIARSALDNNVLTKWLYDYGDGSDGALSYAVNTTIAPGLYQATTFSVSAGAVLDLSAPGPLIIMAQTSIILSGTASTIDVDGMGAEGGADQDGGCGIFGGSGGGGSSGGWYGGGTYLNAGPADAVAGAAQSTRTQDTLLNLPSIISAATFRTSRDGIGGGAGGAYLSGAPGGKGGDGGGLLILISPIVTIGATCVITADGAQGGLAAGGGGGGAVIIATPASGYTNSGTVAAAAGLKGSGAGTHKDGGAGWVRNFIL